MSELLNTSVALSYQTPEVAPPDIVLEEDNTFAAYGHKNVRMYYSGPTPTVMATSGQPVQIVGQNVTSTELDFITFQGSREARFRAPVVGMPALSPLGTFFGEDGYSAGDVGFSVDAEHGLLIATRPVYGTVQARYTSRFDRLTAGFQRIPGAKDDPAFKSEFAPMVVVARQASTKAMASLSLTPPDKPDQGGYSALDGSTGERIVLELDDAFPVSLAHTAPSMPGLTAVARVAVYSPHGGVSFSSSSGVVAGDPYALDDLVVQKETVAFNAAQSASVKYPPVHGIQVRQTGPLTSKHAGGTGGSNGTFAFATAPYSVTLADWVAFGTYVITGAREVQANEIVVTSSGVAIPVSGAVQAEYTTSRTYVSVYWPRQGPWFPPVVLTATDAWGNTESLTISPPERRGR